MSPFSRTSGCVNGALADSVGCSSAEDECCETEQQKIKLEGELEEAERKRLEIQSELQCQLPVKGTGSGKLPSSSPRRRSSR